MIDNRASVCKNYNIPACPFTQMCALPSGVHAFLSLSAENAHFWVVISRGAKFMDLAKIPLFAQLKGKMAWLVQRQKILAENIANADTPGYVPKDLKQVDFSRQVAAAQRKIRVVSTREGHTSPKVSNASFRANEQRDPYEIAPAGNAVVIEEQMMKVAETQIDYQMMTSIYKKNIGFIKMALGKRR